MTFLQGTSFALLIVMVLIWFVCVGKLSRHLRERHPHKYEQMGLAHLWPRGLREWDDDSSNAGPVFALLRFLFRREDLTLHDTEVSNLSVFMRWFFYAYVSLFLIFLFSLLRSPDQPGQSRDAVEAPSQAEQRRGHAFELHNTKKWPEAIAAYDELLREFERDAELRYWRGMAHFELGHTDQALQDFRRVIELEPANFEAYRSADRILSRQRRWGEVLEMWDRYIARVPANAEAYFERGGTNFQKGDFAAAHADAAKACELGKSEACALAERLKSKL